MRLFNFFKSKKRKNKKISTHRKGEMPSNTESIVDVKTGWLAYFKHYEDFDDDKKWKKSEKLLNEIALKLTDSKIIRDESSTVELRGRYDNRPVRIIANIYSRPGGYELEMKAPNLGWLWLCWSLKAIPKPKGQDEDWADDDHLIRLFLAKGLYLEGYENEIDEQLSVYRSLPVDFVEDLINTIQQEKMWGLFINYNMEGIIRIEYYEQYTEMKEPVEKVSRGLLFMSRIARYFNLEEVVQRKSKSSKGGHTKDDKSKRITCTYCTSVFIHDTESRCPNCGASG